jgi:hypothetical protein
MATWIARLGAGFEPVREFFAQRTAERTVRAYLPEQRVRVRAHFDAADGRVRAARRLGEASVASVLLRDAVTHYLFATQWARSAAPADGDAATPERLSRHLPTLAPDPLRPDASPSDDERVRGALAATDPLFFDRLAPVEAALTRTALDRSATVLRSRLEPRSLTNVRATRWGRLAALVLFVAYVAIAGIHSAVAPKNVALGKPVHASSIKGRSPDGHELVDGEVGTSYGLATNTDDSPNVVIDLVDTFRIQSVNVYNRVDGAYDDCLPLVLELSSDGANYVEVARRDQHFGADPPWTIRGGGRLARYVRLRVARRGYLALSEVEVFGKKP